MKTQTQRESHVKTQEKQKKKNMLRETSEEIKPADLTLGFQPSQFKK